MTLKAQKIPHVQGCLVNEQRIIVLENILLDVDNVVTAKENSKSSILCGVNLMEDVAKLLHRCNKIDDEIQNIKHKLNELIHYVKNKTK